MKNLLRHQGEWYQWESQHAIDISIPLRVEGPNPTCYYAEPVQTEVIRAGDFVGSVAEGGSVNHSRITLIPHGNGTHTECYGHLSPDRTNLQDCLRQFHFVAKVLSIAPSVEAAGDMVISWDDFLWEIGGGEWPEAIIIRTLPNGPDKLIRNYSGTNPPYLDPRITVEMAQKGVKHLLIDLPSIDREADGGALTAHRAFWTYPAAPRKDATITELIYVPDEVEDGLYLLNLQITSLTLDASPSKPVLYHLSPLA